MSGKVKDYENNYFIVLICHSILQDVDRWRDNEFSRFLENFNNSP